MRVLARQIITDAAVLAGMAAESVMDAPEKQSIILPMPRLELEYMPESLDRSYQRVSKFASAENPETHRTVRARIYKRELVCRATIRADDEDWLAQFANGFIAALPGKTSDASNNLVVVAAAKAVRGGFGYKTVEAFIKRSNTVHVVFEGMIAKDEDVPLIKDVNLKDYVDYEEQGG